MSELIPSVGVMSTNREPQFATVTLLSADESEKTTFRVPIAADTTVRQLAKEAMRRFVLSRRHAGGAALPAVTQVYVGGHSTQPSAELFARDVVTQVMLVKDEVVFMKLRDNGGAAAAKEAPSTARTSPTCSPPAPGRAAAVAPAEEGHERGAPAATRGGALAERGVNEERAATANAGQSGKENEHRKPAKGKAPPPAKVQQEAKAKQAEERRRKEKKESPYAVVKRERRADAEVEPEVAEIQERERRRMGWSAHLHSDFAANYVSSPDKLFRARRQQRPEGDADRKRERAAAEGRPTVAAPKRACVARHIDFEDAADGPRSTVGHGVELAVDSPAVEEKRTSVPKGWGAQSLKYFDPDTYCDNPAKAVLSDEVLSRTLHNRYAS
ncbi:hypothetical protein STCU_10596 [Strigomonas culicis]|uniref:Uncharacterized protein n=1 Tax=Strigomonas culicis TaxID=28005 RepID=S9TKX7_9TRYP|nr:hypothetical protein STCU_10596 [Strigomonas culicis]|eukprot:EPY17469.1 hypothetical protein STCU_10596 [Strigomonas culicis]